MFFLWMTFTLSIFANDCLSIGNLIGYRAGSQSTSNLSDTMADKYITVEKGTPNSKNYRLYFTNQNGNAISPMHDIPLHVNESSNLYNMIVEIPRWTNAKMEINVAETLNPIKQDIKDGKLRFVANCFPYHGYIWNYGAFPQTWENPNYIEPSTGTKGDNDPIDVLEIGPQRVAKRGEVLQVKILGVIGVIDEGETDWKVLAIDINDPKASQVNDIDDVDKVFPGLLKATVEWFKIYKMADGKPENQVAFNGEAKDVTFATEIVNETHQFWQQLIENQLTSDKISCANTVVADSPFVISQEQADQVIASADNGGTAEPIPDTINTWHYIIPKEENRSFAISSVLNGYLLLFAIISNSFCYVKAIL